MEKFIAQPCKYFRYLNDEVFLMCQKRLISHTVSNMWKPIKNVQAKYNMTCADLVLPPPESV